MFNLQQIHEAFEKVKSGADFPRFVQDLKLIGVKYYDNYLANGRTVYFGENGFIVNGESKYPEILIAETGSADQLKHAIHIHQQGETDYPAFCIQAANAGVEKWRTHMIDMTVTYLDKDGKHLLEEAIPH